MGTMNFIAALIEALAWPLAIVFLLLFFRLPITELVSRITRISHNGTTIADISHIGSLQAQWAA